MFLTWGALVQTGDLFLYSIKPSADTRQKANYGENIYMEFSQPLCIVHSYAKLMWVQFL